MPCTLSRVPLEGYRETCDTAIEIGARHGAKPIRLATPITIAGMSYGALSRNAKQALGMAATRVGISTTTGDGGMLDLEREASDQLVYQVLPSRYGFNPHHLRMANAAEIVDRPGREARHRRRAAGREGVADHRRGAHAAARRRPALARAGTPTSSGRTTCRSRSRSCARRPTAQIPIYVKIGACRVADDVKLACKAGADVIVMDGMEGGTGASPDSLMDHTGIPTMAALVRGGGGAARDGAGGRRQPDHLGRHPQRRGRRQGAGAGRRRRLDRHRRDDRAQLQQAGLRRGLRARWAPSPGACHHCHTGLCPVGITTQDEDLIARLPVDEAAERVAGFLNSMTQEMQMFARACGKNDVHDLEPEDLRAMTIEASAITGIPLVGTDFAFRPESFAAGGHARDGGSDSTQRPLRPARCPLAT